MKHILLLFLGLGLSWAWLPAQGFYIEDFGVEVKLHKDGYFDVTETIDCNFTQSKHGLFRVIPYEYVVKRVQGEIALNRLYSNGTYKTYLEEVKVEGNEYVITDEGNAIKIRIGSSDKYVNGEVSYVIHYRVYGAINQFLRHNEFYWNLTGDQWPVEIQRAHWDIEIPGKPQLDRDDFRVYTGRYGSTASEADWEYKSGHFTGQTTQALDAREGITVAIRIPGTILDPQEIPLSVKAEDYVVDRLQTQARLGTDGFTEVEQTFTLAVKDPGGSFSWSLPKQLWVSDLLRVTRDSDEKFRDELRLLYEEVELILMGEDAVSRSLSGASASYSDYNGWTVNVKFREEDLGKALKFRVKYRVWGLLKDVGDQAFFTLSPGLGFFSEPIRSYSMDLDLPEAPLPGGWKVFSSSPSEDISSKLSGKHLSLSSETPLLKEKGTQVGIYLPREVYPEGPPPLRLMSRHYVIEDFEVRMRVREDGDVEVANWFQLRGTHGHVDFRQKVRERYHIWDDDGWTGRKVATFARMSQMLIRDWKLQPNPDLSYQEYQGKEMVWDGFGVDGERLDTLRISYGFNIYGLVHEPDTGGQALYYPILPKMEEPAEGGRLLVEFPEGVDVSKARLRLIFGGQGTWANSGWEPRWEGNTAIYDFSAGAYPGLAAGVKIDFVEEVLKGFSLGKEFQFWILNNAWVKLPLLSFAILLLVWFFLGRDKKFTKMVRFYPPKDITAAEAGLLIDHKLDNRDLLALIYEWADQGYLRIQQNTSGGKKKKSFSLIKLKDLPSNRRKYEITLFKGIFSGKVKGEKVKLSSLRNSFYITMDKARKELEGFAKRQKFFQPGSRGFASLLKWLFYLSIPVFALSYLFSLDGGDRGFPLSVLMTGLIFFFFSKIMAKHGPFGQKQYEALAGFREFIRRAEKDRLQRLVDEDPAYFEHTLAYAIAFGLAEGWVKKFDGILEAPPSYFRSGNGRLITQFTPLEFSRQVDDSLTTMKQSFTSRPAPSGGGYSGSSYSGSSYSSFGSSGGSSFSSGSSYSGGSSGGGYGGGGGGSW